MNNINPAEWASILSLAAERLKIDADDQNDVLRKIYEHYGNINNTAERLGLSKDALRTRLYEAGILGEHFGRRAESVAARMKRVPVKELIGKTSSELAEMFLCSKANAAFVKRIYLSMEKGRRIEG